MTFLSPVKIGLVSNLYPPVARGGAEQIAHRVAHELLARGHEVFVVSTTKDWRPRPAVSESYVERIYRFRPWNFYHPLDDYRQPFAVRAAWHLLDTFSRHPAKALGMVLDAEKPDVVITHNLKGLGMQTVGAIRAWGIHHIHTIHDVQLSIPSGLLTYGEEQSFLNDSFLQRWYEKQMRSIVGSPEVIVSPSRFLAEFYRARGFFPHSRVEVIPNPTPNVAVAARGARKGGPLRLLFAGQLERHKGVKFLLEALGDCDSPCELHVAGEGTLTGYVRGFAERDPRVTYHGFCSLENLMKLFVLSDAVVVPSLCYENSPTVIYESFAAGVPVVAADIGGVGELVRDGENGLLFRPGDRDNLKNALRRLADNRDRLWTQADAIRAAVKDFSLVNYVSKLEVLMQGGK